MGQMIWRYEKGDKAIGEEVKKHLIQYLWVDCSHTEFYKMKNIDRDKGQKR